MTKQLIVTIPAGDLALRREIEQGVEAYADVRQSQNYADPATVKLVLDIVAQGVTIAGGVAGILTFVRSLQQAKAQQGVTVNILIEAPGGPALPVEDADAELLARLLSQPDGR
jgi:hypothetical protein